MKTVADIELNEEKKIKLRNAFIASSFRYSQVELDLIFLLLTIFKENEDTYMFSLASLSNITGRRYRVMDLLQESQSLISRTYSVVERAPGGSGESEEDISWLCYNLFSSISYKSGKITATLTEDAMLLFSQTKSNYTYLQLKSALLLHNKYAKRLYMLLSQWAYCGTKDYSMEELRRLLTPPLNPDETESGLYKTPYDFCLMVERAVGDINRITELSVEMEMLRQVRTVVSISFKINSQDSRRMLPLDQDAIDFNSSIEKNELVGMCRQRGLTKDQAMEMWDKGCRVKKFKEVVAKANKGAIARGDVQDPLAYLVACIAKEGYLTVEKSEYNLEDISRKQRKRQYREERRRMIAIIRQSMSAGVDVASFAIIMNNYDIRPEDLR